MPDNPSTKAKAPVPVVHAPSAKPPVVSTVQPEIPPAPAGENIDELVRKINALRSSSGNTGYVPPSAYSSAEGIPSVSPASRMDVHSESSSSVPPGFSSQPTPSPMPFPETDTLPRASAASFSNPSKVVQQLQDLSKGKTDTFEQLMQDKPKTLIEEYGDTKIYRVQGEPLMYYTIPVARPTVSERAIINTLKEAATRLISITPYRIRDPEQKEMCMRNKS